MRDKKGVGLDGREVEEDLGRGEGEDLIAYTMWKKYFK